MLRNSKAAGIHALKTSLEGQAIVSLGNAIDRGPWDFPDKQAISGLYVKLEALSKRMAPHKSRLYTMAFSWEL